MSRPRRRVLHAQSQSAHPRQPIHDRALVDIQGINLGRVVAQQGGDNFSKDLRVEPRLDALAPILDQPDLVQELLLLVSRERPGTSGWVLDQRLELPLEIVHGQRLDRHF